MYGCALGNTESVRKLVSAHQHGAIDLDPCIANAEGTTAMDYAEDSRDEEIKGLVNAVIVEVSGSPVNETIDVCKDKESCTVKTSSRIKQLAGTIGEKNAHLGNGSTSMVDKTLVVWKGTDDGNTDAVWSTSTPTPSREDILPNKKSVLNIHLPRPHEELQDGLENDTFAEEQVNIPDQVNQKETFSPIAISPYTEPRKQTPSKPNRPNRDKKNRKKKGKKRKSIEKDTDGIFAENMFLFPDRPPKKDFGEEIVFCNKIYGADLYPCEGEEKKEQLSHERQITEMVQSITHKAYRDFKKARESRENFDIDRVADSTGKLDYIMAAQDRGKLLGRTIWSVYGEPLPPIPITPKTMEKVILGITRLQRHLGKAKYQPGRLLSLDPEMWCILESVKAKFTIPPRPRKVVLPKHDIVWPDLPNYPSKQYS